MTCPFRDNGEWLFVPTVVKLLAINQSKMCLKPWELINQSLLSWIRPLLSRTYFLSSPLPKGKAEISLMFVLLSCFPFLLLVNIYIWLSVGFFPLCYYFSFFSFPYFSTYHFISFDPVPFLFLLAFPFLLPSEASCNSNGKLWVDKWVSETGFRRKKGC